MPAVLGAGLTVVEPKLEDVFQVFMRKLKIDLNCVKIGIIQDVDFTTMTAEPDLHVADVGRALRKQWTNLFQQRGRFDLGPEVPLPDRLTGLCVERQEDAGVQADQPGAAAVRFHLRCCPARRRRSGPDPAPCPTPAGQNRPCCTTPRPGSPGNTLHHIPGVTAGDAAAHFGECGQA